MRVTFMAAALAACATAAPAASAEQARPSQPVTDETSSPPMGTEPGHNGQNGTDQNGQAAAAGQRAVADLRDGKGKKLGTVTLTELPRGVLVLVELKGAPPGVRGFHVHETGACEAPRFDSAGDHFAPKDRPHGFHAEGGPHAGDLPNLHIPASGNVKVELFAPELSLREGAPGSVFDDDGTAFVLHEGADDYVSQPTGQAGGRVACGVIRRAQGK